MKIDRDSNKFTFIFASIMVVVVSVLLSGISSWLKPIQEKNLENEKRQFILRSVKIEVTREESQVAFDQYISKQIVLNYNAEVLEGVEAFDISLKKEVKKNLNEQRFPLYIATVNIDNISQNMFIIPMSGIGLWGSISGYVSILPDLKTVYGVVFDHEKETPGLGAEIVKPFFTSAFEGKQILDSENHSFMPIKVVKGGVEQDNLHGVDAISGATITCNGVSEMLARTLTVYNPYFEMLRIEIQKEKEILGNTLQLVQQ